MLHEVSESEYQKYAANLVQIINKPTVVVVPVNKSISNRCFVFVNADEKLQACAVLYFPELKYLGEKSCFFGNFICVENADTFANFFIELEKIAIAAEIKYLTGPMNGSTWNNYRWSMNGNVALFPGDVANPAFYPTSLQNIGYEIISRYQTSKDTDIAYDKETTARKSAQLSNLKWHIRPLDSHRIKEELSRIYYLSATAFARNFLYTPISEKDFITKYETWLQVIPTEMILLAEDEKGNLLGFLLAYPDGKNGVVIKTLARRGKDKYRGIGLMLCQRLYDFLKEEKYDYVLHALMLQDNYSIKTSTTLSGNSVREYALFSKEL